MGRFQYREVDIPPDGLSAEAVEGLWGRYRRGRGLVERNRLWEHYCGLAYRCAVKVKGGMGQDWGVTVGDLAQWASEGLRGAIEDFDPGRKVKFETYAWPRMRGGVLDGLRRWDVLGRAGRRYARAALEGSESRSAVMALRLGRVRRFSEIVGEGGRGSEPQNQIGVAPVLALDAADGWAWLLRGQSREDRLILTLYYREGLTMAEVGAAVGGSQPMVTQRIRAAQKLIRARVAGRALAMV